MWWIFLSGASLQGFSLDKLTKYRGKRRIAVMQNNHDFSLEGSGVYWYGCHNQPSLPIFLVIILLPLNKRRWWGDPHMPYQDHQCSKLCLLNGWLSLLESICTTLLSSASMLFLWEQLNVYILADGLGLKDFDPDFKILRTWFCFCNSNVIHSWYHWHQGLLFGISNQLEENPKHLLQDKEVPKIQDSHVKSDSKSSTTVALMKV